MANTRITAPNKPLSRPCLIVTNPKKMMSHLLGDPTKVHPDRREQVWGDPDSDGAIDHTDVFTISAARSSLPAN